MKQYHIIATVHVVAGNESIRHNHIASVSNVPVWGLNGLALLRPITRYSGSLNKKSFFGYCLILIKRYLCGANLIHRHCKRVGHEIIEKHRQFYYGSVHIISVMCEVRSFDPFRTAFLYNSSKCEPQMNQPLKATATPVAVPVKAGIVSNWHNLASVPNVPVWGLNGLALFRLVTRYSGSLNKKSFSGYCRLLINLSLTTATNPVSVPVKVGSFPAWRTIAKMFNTLPDEAGTSLKACSMPAVCLSLVFAYFLMLEGGAQ